MSTVTQIVKQTKQPRGGYLPVASMTRAILPADEELSPIENIDPALVGTAVDYLTRLEMGVAPEESFAIPLLGAANVHQTVIAENMLGKVRAGLSESSVVYACKLAAYDVAFRQDPDLFDGTDRVNPSPSTVRNIQVMVRRSVRFLTATGPLEQTGFTFPGGYTSSVDSGDGDYLARNTIWDFKVSRNEFTSDETFQILIYYILGQHSSDPELQKVTRIGLFNPRTGLIAAIWTSQISEAVIKEIEANVMGYGIEKPTTEIPAKAPAASAEENAGVSVSKKSSDFDFLNNQLSLALAKYEASGSDSDFQRVQATVKTIKGKVDFKFETKSKVEIQNSAQESEPVLVGAKPNLKKPENVEKPLSSSTQKQVPANSVKERRILAKPVPSIASKVEIQKKVMNDGPKNPLIGSTLYLKATGETAVVQKIDKKYVYVLLEGSKKVTLFEYPSAIGKYLLQEKDNEMIQREIRLSNPYVQEENSKEKAQFQLAEDFADQKIASYHELANDASEEAKEVLFEALKGNKIENLEWASTLPTIGAARIAGQTGESYWQDIKTEPYFARIVRDGSDSYIGKKEVKDLNIKDWRSADSRYYYEWKMLCAQPASALKIVRSLEVGQSRYYGYFDRFNKEHPETLTGEAETDETITADNYLTTLLEKSRGAKEVHDIIKTIQKTQYEMVSYDQGKNMLVNGCAGSGKTMVIFHRLSYLSFDKETFDKWVHIVITPSDSLAQQTGTLIRDLGLENLFVETPAELFEKAKREYAHSRNLSYINQSYDLEGELEEDKLQKVYSETGLREFFERINEICLNVGNARSNFISNEITELNNLTWSAFGKKRIVKFKEFDRRHEASFKLFKRMREAIEKCSYPELVNIVRRNASGEEDTLRGYKKLIKKILDLAPDLPTPVGAPDDNIISDQVWKMLSVFGVNPTAKNSASVKRLMQAENDETEKQLFKCGRVEDSPNDIFTNVFAPMYQIYKRISGFDDFVEGHNDKYIFSVINTIVDSTKRQRRIELNTHYGFEELYFVYSLERLYGPAYSDICHFFIDEFQNYSKSELTVISGLYGSCKIDAFGDPSQRIDNKDVSLYELLSEDPKWQPFFINENYRNSIEITEYLNQEFGMNMTPIGLHGKMIQANDLKEGIKALDFHPDSNDRVALIYNGGWLKRLQASVPEAEANFISDDNPEIVRNKINILTPAQAKGLEFERVLVVSLGMTKEEKYVACSRPLNVLILVEKSRED